MTTLRKGQAPEKLERIEFHQIFRRNFDDPAFDAVADELARIEDIAWDGYVNGRKAPRTAKAASAGLMKAMKAGR